MAVTISGSDGGAVVTTSTQKVLQVVNLVYSTESSLTIGTTDTAITGMTLDITPVGTGSKFRIDVRLFGEAPTTYNRVFNIHRDGVRVNTTSGGGRHGLSMSTITYEAADNSTTPEMLNFSTVDSTGSTAGTSITYTLVGSGISGTQWINRCFSSPTASAESGISEIIITEIGA
tara:strand:- start:6 stop:527 length:522 start_codon:yes stop_codon:yes gene_type:complete